MRGCASVHLQLQFVSFFACVCVCVFLLYTFVVTLYNTLWSHSILRLWKHLLRNSMYSCETTHCSMKRSESSVTHHLFTAVLVHVHCICKSPAVPDQYVSTYVHYAADWRHSHMTHVVLSMKRCDVYFIVLLLCILELNNTQCNTNSLYTYCI